MPPQKNNDLDLFLFIYHQTDHHLDLRFPSHRFQCASEALQSPVGTLDRKPCYQTITAAAICGKSKHLKAERQ